MAFRRVNIAANRSELRLIIGDDPTADPAAADFFSIGAAPGGTWTPVIGFRSDGLASKPGGGTWAAISDPRTKHDIAPLSGALDLLLSLRGYSFFYNDNEVTKGRALPGRQIGLMADEVERVFPDWVSRDGDGIRMVTERGTTALTVEALRELRDEKDRQIDALQADLARRDADLAAQQRQINDLLTRLERLESAGKP
ncbi:MAG: tail fiber domain-containing protein [Planctomycetaceae bacterium]|nr:tail fiber domain-containing protein [Planctomycetaceae bacterium]